MQRKLPQADPEHSVGIDKPHHDLSPEYVITLVHGTFALNAGWTRDGSSLRKEIAKSLGEEPRAHFEVVAWRGLFNTAYNNTHHDRLHGGEILAGRLRTILNNFPHARHFVVAHSHGGNVALYAMRDETVRQRLSGIVCMATPFIHCRPRPLQVALELLGFPFLILLSHALPLLVMGAFFWLLRLAIVFVLHILRFPVTEAIDGPVAIVTLGLWSTMLQWLRQKLPHAHTEDDLREWLMFPGMLAMFGLRKAAERWQQRIVRRLHAPVSDSPPVLCVRDPRDEVAQAMSRLQKVTDLPLRFWNRRAYFWAGGLLFLFSLISILYDFLANTQPYLYDTSIHITNVLGAIYVMLPLATLATIFVLLPAMVLLHLMLMALLPTLLRLLGFGAELPVDHLLTHITTNSTPEGCDYQDMVREGSSAGLKHSGLYLDEKIMQEVADWINRQAVADKYQESSTSQVIAASKLSTILTKSRQMFTDHSLFVMVLFGLFFWWRIGGPAVGDLASFHFHKVSQEMEQLSPEQVEYWERIALTRKISQSPWPLRAILGRDSVQVSSLLGLGGNQKDLDFDPVGDSTLDIHFDAEQRWPLAHSGQLIIDYLDLKRKVTPDALWLDFQPTAANNVVRVSIIKQSDEQDPLTHWKTELRKYGFHVSEAPDVQKPHLLQWNSLKDVFVRITVRWIDPNRHQVTIGEFNPPHKTSGILEEHIDFYKKPDWLAVERRKYNEVPDNFHRDRRGQGRLLP